MPNEQLIETLIVSGITLVVVFFIVLRGILKQLDKERKAHDLESEQRRNLQNQVAEKDAHIEALKTKVTTQRDELAILKHEVGEAHQIISAAFQKQKISSWQLTAVLVIVGLIAVLVLLQLGQNRKMLNS